MKLIKKTYLSSLKWLIPAILIGSGYCYWMIEYIEHEETDEFLTYEMERLIVYHDKHDDLPEYHKVADIISDVYYAQPVFKDTLMLESGDNEMVPYRELRFSIKHKEKDFTIVLRHLLLGHDDMLEGTLMIVTGLLLIFLFFVFLALRNITGKLWNPFYNTLNKLLHYNISEPVPELSETKIDEFEQLNTVLTTLLNKIYQDYRTNKEFNENISHELQTHLAVMRTTVEKILNNWEDKNANIKEVKSIYTSINKLSQIQRSLSLLNKIENGEFNNRLDINLKNIVDQSLKTYKEIIDLKHLKLNLSINNSNHTMDSGLAEIMVVNLIKNAVIHNTENGVIGIYLDKDKLIVKNTGTTFHEDPRQLMKRFSKGEDGDTGIGLAIVDQICKIYHFSLDYSITKEFIHTIFVSFH
ncbi:MAG: HAMP domain-containing histidine kinase [Vicingus serpentipes]|nr:HAMP domain-containing histidine kinase [Vicingus serpentipes]